MIMSSKCVFPSYISFTIAWNKTIAVSVFACACVSERLNIYYLKNCYSYCMLTMLKYRKHQIKSLVYTYISAGACNKCYYIDIRILHIISCKTSVTIELNDSLVLPVLSIGCAVNDWLLIEVWLSICRFFHQLGCRSIFLFLTLLCLMFLWYFQLRLHSVDASNKSSASMIVLIVWCGPTSPYTNIHLIYKIQVNTIRKFYVILKTRDTDHRSTIACETRIAELKADYSAQLETTWG